MSANNENPGSFTEDMNFSPSEEPEQLVLISRQSEITLILEQNYQVKKEMARQLHASGLSIEAIGRVLNLRIRIVKE